MKNEKYRYQRGGVSIFLVLFACLLVTLVTVGFITVMIKNQQQVTDSSLADSAYDSAIAGVEDAKRVAIIYRQCKTGELAVTTPQCVAALSAVDSKQCNTTQAGLQMGGSPDEVPIKNSEGDTESAALQQAYTCVKMDYYTDDVVKSIGDGATQLIYLRPVDDPANPNDGYAFNKVKISWFTKGDSNATGRVNPRLATNYNLPVKTAWDVNPANGLTPPILRIQYIQTASSFTMNDFNDSTSGSNTNTAFLYPTTIGNGADNQVNFTATDPRPNTIPKGPVQVKCESGLFDTIGTYACSATIYVPAAKGGTKNNAFLLVSSVYHDTSYRVQMYRDNDIVQFDGVQPAVDSTGRANDLFRRVDARVDFYNGNFNYPSAAVDLSSSLCKAFAVTDDVNDYNNGGCAP